jgi:hypothetical protein
VSKEYKASLLDWFGKIYRQTGSFKDQDGNVYLIFERSRFWFFKERIVLRTDWLEVKKTAGKGPYEQLIYVPKLKHE